MVETYRALGRLALVGLKTPLAHLTSIHSSVPKISDHIPKVEVCHSQRFIFSLKRPNALIQSMESFISGKVLSHLVRSSEDHKWVEIGRMEQNIDIGNINALKTENNNHISF